jgi:Fungalysin metallopeptidase (M36)
MPTKKSAPEKSSPAGESQEQIGELARVVQTMTEAVKSLQAIALKFLDLTQAQTQMLAAQARASITAAQINIWGDDPFTEAIPTPNPGNPPPTAVGVPVSQAPDSLSVAILDPEPPADTYTPGTAEFRYWVAAEALIRGVNFWAPRLPVGTRWSTRDPQLQATLTAGEDLNAFYRRDNGLNFFQQTVQNITVFSGESSDVVCHELGHAILDAVRPQLFNAANTETAAFHEAFGDMSSILTCLQLPLVRQQVLKENQGGPFNINSRLSRLAEQLGWAIRHMNPAAVDPDCLRNAVNQFFYQDPFELAPRAPARELSSEVHSFSRVFTGAFYDALAGMLAINGAVTDGNLVAVSQQMGQLLIDAVLAAPVAPDYFSQVATAIIQADGVRNNGRYQNIFTSAFVRHGILSPDILDTLTSQPLPKVQQIDLPAPPSVIAGAMRPSDPRLGMTSLLTYGSAAEDDGFRRGFDELPELPPVALPGVPGLGPELLVHAPVHPRLFSVASAGAKPGQVDPSQAAREFVEDLLQEGRIDFGSTAVGLLDFGTPFKHKTHILVDTPRGKVLQRTHFECAFCATTLEKQKPRLP